MSTIAEIRPSPIAGRWYPGDQQTLARSVDEYLAGARPPELTGEVVALVAPHAGHIYSGATAGYAFRCVQGQTYARVAVISPMHSYYPDDFITSAHRAYQTPLGPVWIDQPALLDLDERMCARGLPGLTVVGRDGEHSLEIELPFLQRALAQPFKLIPVMVRTHDPVALRTFGEALAETVAGEPTLLVASSDLSHFYPLAEANRLDDSMLAAIAALDPERALQTEEAGAGFACGVGAVAAVLWAARAMGANQAIRLHHSTSAEQTGDPTSVVGYGAVAVTRSA